MENICDEVNALLVQDYANVTSELVRWHLSYCLVCSNHGEDPTKMSEGWNPKTLNASVQSEMPGLRVKG